MTSDRNKPGVAFWATVVGLAYPLSFGPACWWFPGPEPRVSYGKGSWHYAPRIYWPVGWLAERAPDLIRDTMFSYATIGTNRPVAVPMDPRGDVWYSSITWSVEKARRLGGR